MRLYTTLNTKLSAAIIYFTELVLKLPKSTKFVHPITNLTNNPKILSLSIFFPDELMVFAYKTTKMLKEIFLY